MSLSENDIAFVHDMFDPLGRITTRRMMGGLSIYCDGRIFAMLDRQAIPYLKASGAFAARLASAGARQFGAGSSQTMNYWTLPQDALDDMAAACDWGRQALAALK